MMGERLYALRRKRGLTQERLGELIGVTHSQISRMERGERDIKGFRLERLCEALHCTPSELLGLQPDTENARARLIQLIALMNDEKIAALTTVAHVLLGDVPHLWLDRRQGRSQAQSQPWVSKKPARFRSSRE
jgi:transcriptional regulator with XRE-family HTH domain